MGLPKKIKPGRLYINKEIRSYMCNLTVQCRLKEINVILLISKIVGNMFI